jgi:hypothetical protein
MSSHILLLIVTEVKLNGSFIVDDRPLVESRIHINHGSEDSGCEFTFLVNVPILMSELYDAELRVKHDKLSF